MLELFGDLAVFKIASLVGVAYLIYFFVKDRRGKK